MTTQNILQYKSKIWATADLLRGCGIKESEWPSYMMPFFALAMIESRLIRMFDELKAKHGKENLAFVDALDYKEQPLVVTTDRAMYRFDADQETLIQEALGQQEALGCGRIVVKAALKKATKTQPERIEVTVELTPDYQKDYEIIPLHRDEVANQRAIAAFMAKYIAKPFEYLENIVGVEINFNKIFYKPEKLRSVEEILGEIAELDRELNCLERSLEL
jgi:type I restriction enzyme M protein